jgi:hypothetical protein
MYCVAYRFTLIANNSETRRQFMEVWSGFTTYFRENCGALGSRLHLGDDGAFYAYAQWPSKSVMEASEAVAPTQNFLRLRVAWSELCQPSEVLWQGELLVDMLKNPNETDTHP